MGANIFCCKLLLLQLLGKIVCKTAEFVRMREAGCAVVGWSIEHVGRTESGDRAAQVLQSTFPRQHQAGTRQATILGWQARLSY